MTAGREFHPALKRYVSGTKIAIIFTIAMLFLLLVSHYGNHIHHDSKHSQHYVVESQILELAALQTDSPEDVHEISGGKEICQILRPCLHGTDRREYSAHQHEYQHKEQHQEHRLKQSVGIVRDYQAEPCHENQEQRCSDIEFGNPTMRGEPIDKMSYQESQGKCYQPQETIKDDFGKDKIPFARR